MKSTSGEPKSENERSERQDWRVVLLILLIGFCCVTAAGQWALRFSPNWTLDTNMESNLDPDSDFSVKPSGFFEPIDSAILTQPAWVKVFLTPGAKFTTGTPPAAAANTTVPTGATTAVPLTSTAFVTTNTVVPTNTFIWLPPPPATNTRRPRPADTPTNTSPPPLPVADLEIAKDDGFTVYPSSGPLTYTITVTNHGPGAVTGATVIDNIPGGLSGATWTCTSLTGGSCTASGSGNINDSAVNLPNGANVRYTITANTGISVFSNLVNTASVSLPVGYTDPGVWTNSDTDTDVPQLGTSPDCVDFNDTDCSFQINTGTSITLNTNITVDGAVDAGNPDLVYYERPSTATEIWMDWVRIEISDGSGWYTVLYWYNGTPPDTNTNISGFSPEDDNLTIPFASLYPYPGRGITIDVDDPALGIPPGLYTQIRITAPPGDPWGDGIAMDAVEILP